MTVSVDVDRRLLPRWQPSLIAIASGELVAASVMKRAALDNTHFEVRKAEWEQARSIEIAAELVASATVLGRSSEIETAARFLAEDGSDVLPGLRELARRALGDKQSTPNLGLSGGKGRNTLEILYSSISVMRRHIQQHPRDVYSYVDLARLYAILGQNGQATRAIQIALALTSEDRFVLRSAARYFVHIEQRERAHRLLLRARSTRNDPWLISAEIAVSQAAGLKSQLATTGQRALDQRQWSPRHSSELQGSIASLLLDDGASQKARGLFRKSLEDPTENAIAQAQWATERTSGLSVPAALLKQPGTHEARALRERMEGRWDDAIADSWQWADYEPTSSRPMVMGSYLASVAYGDGKTIVEFADRGLRADPQHTTLLNNKAVGLAYLGRLEEATAILKKIVIEDSPALTQPMLYATSGLLNFRNGDIEAGRALYEEALQATPSRDKRTRILALWHLAIEEAHAGTPEAPRAISRAERISKDEKLPEIGALRMRAEAESKESNERKAPVDRR